jgi:hypothetical protein
MKTREENITIPEKSYKKITYISEDGREFDRKNDCVEYEEKKKSEEIKKRDVHFFVDYDMPDLGSIDWYYCETEEALDLVLSEHDTYTTWKNLDIAKVGEWFGILYEDGGDHRGTTTVFSLDECKKQFEKFIKEIELIEKKNDK